jgi:hypothetical protein
MQLASRSASEVRSYLLNQQTAGTGNGDKKIFINCENTFGAFKFRRLVLRSWNEKHQDELRSSFTDPLVPSHLSQQ